MPDDLSHIVATQQVKVNGSEGGDVLRRGGGEGKVSHEYNRCEGLPAMIYGVEKT